MLFILGPADSPFISLSGPDINDTVTFTPGGPLTAELTFMLQNDEYGLEDLEEFVLRSSDPEMQDMNLFSSTTIRITDDDGKHTFSLR